MEGKGRVDLMTARGTPAIGILLVTISAAGELPLDIRLRPRSMGNRGWEGGEEKLHVVRGPCHKFIAYCEPCINLVVFHANFVRYVAMAPAYLVFHLRCFHSGQRALNHTSVITKVPSWLFPFQSY